MKFIFNLDVKTHKMCVCTLKTAKAVFNVQTQLIFDEKITPELGC